MKIEYMPVSRLVQYYNNTKVHTPEQVRAIANSIERFGFRQPVVVDRNNVIVIGHGRVLAAKELGLRDIPVTVADDLSDDEINALRLVDNRLNESAWDFSALEDELSTITGIDMSDFGFEPPSEADIAQVTQRPLSASETASEQATYDFEDEYTDGSETGEYGLAEPYTGSDLQATSDYRDSGYRDAQGRQVVGERSLIEAEPERAYRFICPRCKHRFG